MSDFDFVEGQLSPLWDRDRTALGHEQAVALLIWSATGLIENGGLAALVESFGGESRQVADAYRELGLARRAEVVSHGLALFPRYEHPDPSVRLSLPLSRRLGADTRLSKVDEAFYALDQAEPVDSAVAAYMRLHPKAFPGNE